MWLDLYLLTLYDSALYGCRGCSRVDFRICLVSCLCVFSLWLRLIWKGAVFWVRVWVLCVRMWVSVYLCVCVCVCKPVLSSVTMLFAVCDACVNSAPPWCPKASFNTHNTTPMLMWVYTDLHTSNKCDDFLKFLLFKFLNAHQQHTQYTHFFSHVVCTIWGLPPVQLMPNTSCSKLGEQLTEKDTGLIWHRSRPVSCSLIIQDKFTGLPS